MPSTGAMNGTIIVLEVEGTNVARLTSNSINFNRATIDTSNKDSGGYAEFIYGQGTGTIDCEGVFAENSTVGFDDLFGYWQAKTVVTLRWTSEVSGDKYYESEALITSLSMSAPMEDKVTFSASFQFTGAPSTGTI